MDLKQILIDEQIDVVKLEKGLKHIGFKLTKFDAVKEEHFPGLIELFKIATNVDPNKTTKFVKMDLRAKLDKCIKGQVYLSERISA